MRLACQMQMGQNSNRLWIFTILCSLSRQHNVIKLCEYNFADFDEDPIVSSCRHGQSMFRQDARRRVKRLDKNTNKISHYQRSRYESKNINQGALEIIFKAQSLGFGNFFFGKLQHFNWNQIKNKLMRKTLDCVLDFFPYST